MSKQTDKIQIRGSALYGQPHTFAEYQRRSRSCLEEVRMIHPTFRRLAIMGTGDFIPVCEDLSDLEERILEVVSQEKVRDTYLNPLPDGMPGAETTSRDGFSVTYFSYSDDVHQTHLPVENGGVKLVLQGNSAGAEINGGAILALPTNQYGDLHSAAIVRQLWAAVIENWASTVGSVRSLGYERMVEQSGDHYSGQWLLYLPFPYLGQCLPADVHWEPFHKGILIETTPHPPDANNPDDLAAGKRVREVLDGFGLVWQSTYAIHGWPPDEEEWRYEEFITGAPSGRKYRLRCIEFDGYDAERKVLLYAKLFRLLRRQPRQWGLRGWDGPVINEARRQVRAASGEPIEWHIGLEESADRVRTLLAEYTDITQEQLKVIYTPLEQALRSPRRR